MSGRITRSELSPKLNQELDQITQLNESLSEINLVFVNITVGVASFIADTTYAKYPYKAVITCKKVTNAYFADVAFGMEEVISGNYAPISLTGTNTVTIYAVSPPQNNIIIPTIICTKGAN